MKKETIAGKNGYAIPGVKNLDGAEKMAVIISHGFGSSKESPTAVMLAEALPDYGIGTYAFDFPGHGDSPVDGERLRIDTCLDDLAAVEARVREIAPDAGIAYFSSSFGAYINLLYLAKRPHFGRKSFLRSAAVKMPEIFAKNATEEDEEELKTRGFVLLDEGFARPLKITRAFRDDLSANNVFALYKADLAEIAMIHGDQDETASIKDACRFAEKFNAKLTIVRGGEHRLMDVIARAQVLHAATDFFSKDTE